MERTKSRRAPRVGVALLLVALGWSGAAASEEDLAAARALFEANLDAIRNRDRDAYFACYLNAETLARTGPEGPTLGFERFVEAAGDEWPDVFEGRDLRLVPVQPGVVYGTYRYRVAYDGSEHSGISERFFIRTADGWRIAVTTAFEAPPGTPPAPVALVGATLIDGTGAAPVKDAVVVIRGGLIDCAGTRSQCDVGDGVEAIDVRGKWVLPGLVDAHVHFSQTGWADGRPDALDVRDTHPYEEVQADLRARPERWYRSYLCSGVTAVFDVGGYPWTWGLRQRDDDTRAPHVAASGPLLSTLDHWVNLPAERQFIHLADERAAVQGVRYLASHETDAVKIWFIVRQDADFDALAATVRAAGEAAKSRGVPLIVHATELETARVAVESGAHLLVHSIWDKQVDDAFVELLRERGTIYCPTLLVGGGYGRMFESVVSRTPPPVDDPNGCVDHEMMEKLASTAALDSSLASPAALERRSAAQERREAIGAANLARLHAAGVPVAMGTDAGNPLTLHGPAVYAEMEAMQAAGMSAMDVIVSATAVGARAMGRGDELGTVRQGKIADLLVVGGDPTEDVSNLRRVEAVVRGGVLRTIDELRVRPLER